jgi:hypothetical protein
VKSVFPFTLFFKNICGWWAREVRFVIGLAERFVGLASA